MNNELNIPNSYLHRERLKSVVGIVTSIIKIDCIFFSSYTTAPNIHLLTIIISEDSENTYEDERFVRRIFNGDTFIDFKVYTASKVVQSLTTGKIFFLQLFTGTPMVYCDQ